MEDQNPALLRFSPWLRILAGGTCGAAIAIIWDASLLAHIIAVALGTVIGFISRWLDF